MLAEEIMTRKIKTVLPSLSIRELAKFLVKENISGVPVMDEAGNFLGIVTEEDLIFQDKKIHLPTFLNILSNIVPLGLGQLEEELKKVAGTQVTDVMQKNPPTITKQTTVEQIATLMIEEKKYYLPVMQDDQVIGIITKKDLIRAVAKGKIW